MKFFTAVNAYGIGLHQMRMIVPPPYPATIGAKSFLSSILPRLNRMSTLQAYLPPRLAWYIVSPAIRLNRAKRYAQLAGNPAIAHPGSSHLSYVSPIFVRHANSLLPRFTTIHHSERPLSQRYNLDVKK
jgi:hypothetical protein